MIRPQPDSARLRSCQSIALDRGPEGLRQRFGPAARAVGKENPRDAFGQQAVQNRPRRATRAEHHHRPAGLVPARRLFD